MLRGLLNTVLPFYWDIAKHREDDSKDTLDNAEALAREISNARLRVFEGVGHLACTEHAAEVNEEILSLLQAKRRPSPTGGVATGIRRSAARYPRFAV